MEEKKPRFLSKVSYCRQPVRDYKAQKTLHKYRNEIDIPHFEGATIREFIAKIESKLRKELKIKEAPKTPTHVIFELKIIKTIQLNKPLTMKESMDRFLDVLRKKESRNMAYKKDGIQYGIQGK